MKTEPRKLSTENQKLKEKYLAIEPKYVDKKKWIQVVEDVFYNFEEKNKNKQAYYINFLDNYHSTRPRSLGERWVDEARERDAEANHL